VPAPHVLQSLVERKSSNQFGLGLFFWVVLVLGLAEPPELRFTYATGIWTERVTLGSLLVRFMRQIPSASSVAQPPRRRTGKIVIATREKYLTPVNVPTLVSPMLKPSLSKLAVGGGHAQ
jgi:hypothetical protein